MSRGVDGVKVLAAHLGSPNANDLGLHSGGGGGVEWW